MQFISDNTEIYDGEDIEDSYDCDDTGKPC